MFKMNKELKKIEEQQKATAQLNELSSTLKTIDKMVDEFNSDAQECLLNNDEAGFELIANTIFYFQDIQKVFRSIKIQFQTYVKTAQFMDTIEGIRPILKNAANMMSSLPSYNKNNKDFMKFRRGLLKGQVNMRAMSSMMTTINPALDSSRSKEDLEALKEKLLVGKTTNTNTGSNTATNDKPAGNTNDNDDFFNAINID